MDKEQMDCLEKHFGGGEPRHEKQSPKRKYIRCKEAIEVYGMGRTKLTQLAREAGAVIKIDSTLLIDVEAFDRFLEAFRLKGGPIY